MKRPRILRAANDVLFGADGERYIDLFTAHGATFLGHSHPEIGAEIAAQLGQIWLAGGLETQAYADARAQVESFFPPSHTLAGLYSTGMEAAEFALRVARVATGRSGVVGFENSMHGKSLATAYLGWDNRDEVRLPDFHRLPFLPQCPEEEILRRLERTLGGQRVSAVFVEPLQGSGAGHMASDRFYGAVAALCRQHGTLLVFDEILTGFYRTGTPFRFEALGITPDVVLIGKALGNGFPVSGVIVDRRHELHPRMLPNSTFAGNPLACAAVHATLRHMKAMDVAGQVAAIAEIVTTHLGWLRDSPIALRGKGALWVIEFPEGLDIESPLVGIYNTGVCVGFSARQFRILPAATIEPANLEHACAVVAAQLRKTLAGAAARA